VATAALLGLYLKLNLLLAASYPVWLLTKRGARLLRFDVSHAQQLALARVLFMGVAVICPLVFLSDMLWPWLPDAADPPLVEFAAVANLDNSLAERYEFDAVTLVPAVLLAALLLGGLVFQLARLARQVRKLRTIVTGATEYKCISGIHLLFSSMVYSPFSTCALGKNHVVLPYQLLDSPRNLRLAVKHELQHLRNRDLEWVIVYEIAGVFFFWNPAMWLLQNEFDCLQELACDEALVHDRRVNPTSYGNCLLEVARGSNGHALIASSNMVPRFSFWSNRHSQLKRRIVMLGNSGKKKYSKLKGTLYLFVTSFSMLQVAQTIFAADAGSDAVPIVRINPDYPQQALSAGIQGFAIVKFTITETGSVADPTVISNCAWPESHKLEDCEPDDIFNGAALAAVSKWRYTPQIEDGRAVAREGMRTVIRFALDPRGEGCLYSGMLYPVGSKVQVRVYEPSDTVNPRTVEGQTCVEDPEEPGEYSWE
jgi:TonB family protein